MTPKRVLPLLAAVIIAFFAWQPLKWKFFPARGEQMDTGNWVTHCVGRFLIDLPPSAVITRHTRYLWGEKLLWREDLTPETARLEAEKEIAKWRETENKKIKNKMFIDAWDLPNGGIAIIRWRTTYSILYVAQCYFNAGNKPRVFTFTTSFGSSKIELAKKDVMMVASNLYARDAWDPIPQNEGLCFYGGFLASPDKGEWQGSELFGILAEFGEFPGITMAFALWADGINGAGIENHYSGQGMEGLLAERVKILHRGKVDLGVFQAEEVLLTGTGDSTGKKLYNFMLSVPSQEDRRDRPDIYLGFTSLDHQFDDLVPFDSDAEAVGLWKAVSRSIRLRVKTEK